MKDYTTFRLGGPAKYFVDAGSVEDVREALAFAANKGLKVLPLGAGSDVLVPDEGFDGLVIRLINLKGMRVNGDEVSLMCGEALPRVARKLADMGLSGLENLVGVPGTIGGGVAKNAGAHGYEISDVLLEAWIMDLSGEVHRFTAQELNLRYRDSDVLEHGVLLEATFKLHEEDPSVIHERIDHYLDYREKTQPWKERTAGCMFKNPPGYYAGKLIEEAGLKGFRIGGVKVSEKHANFFVNEGGSANDAIRLIEIVRDRVFKSFGVELEVEVVILK